MNAAPTAAQLAWLSLIPTTSPALTPDERGLITAIRNRAVDNRTRARCDLLLAS
jgi:hypothetical protein